MSFIPHLVSFIYTTSRSEKCHPHQIASISVPPDVFHDLRKRAGVDVVEIAEDIYMLWRAIMLSDDGRIVLQRRFIVGNTDAFPIVEVRYVDLVFVFVGFANALRCKARCSAVRVVNHDDVLDPEQMLGDRDGAQRVDGSPAGDDDGENRRRRGYSISGFVAHDLAGKNLVA